jgi:hypothetical protein
MSLNPAAAPAARNAPVERQYPTLCAIPGGIDPALSMKPRPAVSATWKRRAGLFSTL